MTCGPSQAIVGGVSGTRDIRGLLIDLDGVLYVGKEVLPGAREAVQQLAEAGVGLRFLTNTTTKTAAELAAKLKGLGFAIHESNILSAVTATCDYLRNQGANGRLPSVHLLVRESIRSDFADFPKASLETGEGAPDFVVVGDIGAAWSYPLLNVVFNEIMSGARLIAMHRNRYWQGEAGLRMDIGAFVAGLEYVSGVEATVIGKPSPQFFRVAIQSLGLSPENIAMVGDDIDADVGGGQAAGLTGVLVQTGKYRAEEVAGSEVRPDAILKSVAELPEWVLR